VPLKVTIWREHLLQSILLLTPLAGIPIYLLEVNLLKTTAFRGLFIFVLALSILLPVLRNIPYKFRAISNIVLLFLTGFVSLALFGLHINAFLYLLAASYLPAFFSGSPPVYGRLPQQFSPCPSYLRSAIYQPSTFCRRLFCQIQLHGGIWRAVLFIRFILAG
jgi:hypothetical protein